MKERHWKIIVIFVALTGLLLHYQNCGSKAGQSSDPEMGVINPIETGSIQFLQSKTEIDNSTTQLVAHGVCSLEQDGALLSWRLADPNSQETISSGKSLCDRGAFEIIYAETSNLDCNSVNKLTAYLGSQEKTDLIVEKKCL